MHAKGKAGMFLRARQRRPSFRQAIEEQSSHWGSESGLGEESQTSNIGQSPFHDIGQSPFHASSPPRRPTLSTAISIDDNVSMPEDPDMPGGVGYCVLVEEEDDRGENTSFQIQNQNGQTLYMRAVRIADMQEDVADRWLGSRERSLSAVTLVLLALRCSWQYTMGALRRSHSISRFGNTRRHYYNSLDKSFYFISSNSKVRKWVVKVVDSEIFDITVLVLIVLNTMLLCLQVEGTNISDSAWNDAMHFTELVFLILFSFELILRSVATGLCCHKGALLRDPWGVLDFLVVFVGWLETFVGVNLTVLRAARAFRPLRTVKRVEGLRRVVTGFLRSMPAVGNAFFLMFFNLVVFSILGLDFFVGVLHNRCVVPGTEVVALNDTSTCGDRSCGPGTVCVEITGGLHGYWGYDDLWDALMLSMKVASMDNWPLDVERHQQAMGHHAWIFFVALVFLCSFFILTFTLAAVASEMDSIGKNPLLLPPPAPPLDRPGVAAAAASAQVMPLFAIAFGYFPQDDKYLKKFLTIASGQGQELTGRSPRTPALKALMEEGAGKREGEEEGEEVNEAETPPEEETCLQKFILTAAFRYFFLALTMFNLLVLAADHHDSPAWLDAFVNWTNFSCSVLFLVEFVVKVVALGCCGYFEDAFNIVDFILVLLSVPDILQISAAQGANSLRTIRMLRVARSLRLKLPKSMRTLLRTTFDSFLECVWLVVLMLLFLFIWAVLGMQLFTAPFDPNLTRLGFQNLWEACITVFVFAITGEEWATLAALAQENYNIVAALYFVLAYIVGNCIMLNVFVGIITSKIDDMDGQKEDKEVEEEEEEKIEPGSESSDAVTQEEEDEETNQTNGKKGLVFLDKYVAQGCCEKFSRAMVGADERRPGPLQGKSMGCLGPHNKVRRWLQSVVEHPAFDVVITISIVANLVAVSLDSPALFREHPGLEKSLDIADIVFGVVFTVEVLARVAVRGFYCESDPSFLREHGGIRGWNLVDLLVAVVSAISPFVA
eukprot:Hpha_TRINITY_DN9504_c0_g1::TRINITY_DN9504_c0_g1_i1::g.114833::m.114833/K04851/CACNA1D; voltage-dependent calcium channel L type alpha-1D